MGREFVLSVARTCERDAGKRGGLWEELLRHAAKELWSDREFVLEMLAVLENRQSTNKIIRSIPKQLLSDRNVVLAVARSSRWILRHVPVELRAEIHSALSKEGHVSSAPSTRQAHRPGGVPRRAPSESAPRSQRPASQRPLDNALEWLEPSSFKELRAA